MAPRHFPKRQSIPETGFNPSEKPPYQSYIDTPGTANRWKRITDTSAAIAGGANASSLDAKGKRMVYPQYPCIDSEDGYVTGSWYSNRWTLDNGYDKSIGNKIYVPRMRPEHPRELIGRSNTIHTRIVKVDYSDNSVTTVRDFSNNVSIGGSQGGLSRDGKKCVIQEEDGSGYMCHLIDIDTGSTITSKHFSSIDDFIGIHPDGQHIVRTMSAGHDNGGGWVGVHSYEIYDTNFTYLRTVGISGHIGLGFDFDDTTPLMVGAVGEELAKIDISTGAVTRIGGGPARFQNNPQSLALHCSYAYDCPGHFLFTGNDLDGPAILFTLTAEPSDGISENALFWGHHNGLMGGDSEANYYAMPQGGIHPTGTRVVFASDWNLGVGTSQVALYDAVDSYLVEVKAGYAPVFTAQSFNVSQNASVGTVVGQLAAIDPQDGNASITTSWRLHNLRNAGFAVSDSGLITVAEAGAASAIGVQTTSVIVEGSQAQTANDVTITVIESGVPIGSTYTHDISTSQSAFDTGRAIQSVGARSTGVGSTLHWNPGAVFATAKDGGEQNAYTVMKSAINGSKNKVDDNGDYVYKTFMVSVLWKWGEPGNQNYSSGGAWQFIDDCIALLNAGQTLGIYWIDRRFNADDITDTPIPSDLRTYPNSYFYPSGETLATANLARPNVNDRKIALLKETGRRYNANAKVVFITSGETSIHLPTGNVTNRDGDSVSHNESYFSELMYLFNESKTDLSNILLLTEINFISTFDARTSMQLSRALINNMIATGGGGISLPDALACRNAALGLPRCCDNAGSYTIEAYGLITEFQGQIVIAPQAQTWSAQHDKFPEDFDMITDGVGAHSWHSHYPIFWPQTFVSRCSRYDSDDGGVSIDYEAIVRAEIVNNPAAFNTTLPGGGTQSGSNPIYSDVTFAGTTLLISGRPGTTVLDIDEFTVVFADAPTVDEPIVINFIDSGGNVTTCDGTATPEEPVLITLSAANVVQNGAPGWDQIAATANYPGDYLLRANGHNFTSPYKNGSYIAQNLSDILAVGVTFNMFVFVASGSGGDSIRVGVNDGAPSLEMHLDVSDDSPHWQFVRSVTSADNNVSIYSREMGTEIGAMSFVPNTELSLPTGKHGFCTTAVSFPAGISASLPELMTIDVGQEYTIDTNYVNANTLDVFYYTQATNNIEIVSYASAQIALKGTEISNGGYVNFVVAETGTDPQNSITFQTVINVVGSGGSAWPEGVSATLPVPFTVILGNSFSINAFPVNPQNDELLSDRWYSDSGAVLFQSGTDSAANYMASSLGVATIYYTMERAADSSNAQVYTTVVTVIAESIGDWPGAAIVDVGGDRTATTQQAQFALAAEHVDGFNTTGEWVSDDTGVVFASTDKYTEIQVPSAGSYLITRKLSKTGEPSATTVEDSFTLTVTDPVELSPRNDRFCSEPRIAVELVTSLGSVWIIDYPNTPVPNGAVVLDAQIEQGGISTVSQQVNIRKGSSDIGTATLKFVDYNRSLTDFLHSLLSTGNTLLNQQVKIYRMCKGQEFDYNKLWRTYIFDKYTSKDNLYTFSCKDVQRYLQTDIMTPHTGRLAKSIAVDDMAIPVIRPDGYFEPFVHNSRYRLHPNMSVMYVQIKTTLEVFAADSIYTDADDGIEYFNVIERGVFQTTAAEVVVSPETSEDNLPGLTEIPFLAGPAPEISYQKLTGVSRDGSVTLPSHWHAHVPASLVSRDSFDGIGDDIESTHLEFINPKKQTAKTWIEQQCFIPMRCVPFVNSYGEITIRRSQPATPDAAAVGTLTEDDIVSYSDYSTNFGTIKNGLLINWGWNWSTETYLQPTMIVDSDSQNQHGYTEYETLNLKGLQSSVSTSTSVKTTADVIRGHISHEGLGLTIKVMPDRDFYDAGDVIRINLGNLVKDPSGQAVELDRSMLITRRSENIYTGDVSYQLYGIGRAIESIADSPNKTPIPLEKLAEGATELSTVCTIVGGEIQGANNVSAGVYYYDGDLSHNPSTGQLLQSTPGTIELRVAGEYNPYHAQSIVTKSMGGVGGAGQAAYPGRPQSGEPKYFGSVTSANGILREKRWRRASNDDYVVTAISTVTDLPGEKTLGVVSSLPLLPLQLSAGVLTGYPLDISGSGSPGAGAHATTQQEPYRGGDASLITPIVQAIAGAGADGANGGGGLIIISRGGSTGPAGGFDVSGDDGEQGVYSAGANVFAGSSAGGMPGCLLWLIDGDYFAPTLQGRVDANAGNSTVGGTNAIAGSTHNSTGADIRPSIDPDAGGDYSGACVSVQYVPVDSIPQHAPLVGAGELSPYLLSLLSQIQAEAENQIDDTLKVIADDAKPSFGNEGDRWVATAERDAAGYPAIYRHDGSNYQSEEPSTSFVAKMLQLQYGTAYIADSKGAYYLNVSDDPVPPIPTSPNDMWIQVDTGVQYPSKTTVAGFGWDFDQPIADDKTMSTSSNLLIDPSFLEAGKNSKLTWEPNSLDTNIIDFGPYGEGGAYGCRMIASSGVNPNIISAVEYPAARGEILRIGQRVECNGAGDAELFIVPLDINGNQAAPVLQFSESGKNGAGWFTMATVVEMADPAYASVQSMQVISSAYSTGSMTMNVDYVFVERGVEFTQTSRVATESNLAAIPSLVQTALVNVYSTDDEIKIDFTGKFQGDGAGDAIGFLIEAKAPGGALVESVTLENNFVVDSGVWVSRSGSAVFTGLPVGQPTITVKAWGSTGTSRKDIRIDKTIKRG